MINYLILSSTRSLKPSKDASGPLNLWDHHLLPGLHLNPSERTWAVLTMIIVSTIKLMQQSMKKCRETKSISWSVETNDKKGRIWVSQQRQSYEEINGLASSWTKARKWRWRDEETRTRNQKETGNAQMPLGTGFWVLPCNTSSCGTCPKVLHWH